MIKVSYIVDVPGWSTDHFMQRVRPHFKDIQITTHYIFSSKEDSKKGLRSFPDIPEADVYWFGSWWWYWEWIKRRERHLDKVVVDVVDDYSWIDASLNWQIVRERSDLLMTQSLPFLSAHPGAVFHPFPVDLDWFCDPVRKSIDCQERPLIVGMIASGFAHHGGDHKGVSLARAACSEIPGVELIIAGIDRLYPFNRLIEFYREIDVFLCLSRSEGFSSSMANAAAMGVPILSTPVSPAEPFIGDDGYFFIPHRDSGDHEILNHLCYLLERFKKEHLTVFNQTWYTRNVANEWKADKVARIIERNLKGLIS